MRLSICSRILIVILLLLKRSSLADIVVDCITYGGLGPTFLNLHNEKRKIHNSVPLRQNNSLASSSLLHAQVLAQKRAMYHDAHGVGENLFSWAGGKLPDPKNDPGAVKGWYDEVECYCGYESEFPPCVYGHFTQLVWNGSTDLGCATCVNNDPSPYLVVVCRYWPPGNWCGEYAEHVAGPFGKPNNTLYDIVKAYMGASDSFHRNVEKRLVLMFIMFFIIKFLF